MYGLNIRVNPSHSSLVTDIHFKCEAAARSEVSVLKAVNLVTNMFMIQHQTFEYWH
jgi:hypothetical protein